MPYGAILGQKPKESTEATIENCVVNTGESVTAGQVVDVILTYGSNTLSGQTEGNIVKLNENGQPVEFYVAQQNYEPELNGYGRTLLVRKNAYQNGQWNNTNVNTYANSTIDNWFNNTYKLFLDSWAQTAIATTSFYYTLGNGNATLNTLSRSVFALSLIEVFGKTFIGANVEGKALSISSILKTINQTTRSPYTTNTSLIWNIISGGASGVNATNNCDYRPCFTLPANLIVQSDGTVTSTPSPTPPTYTITTAGTPSTAIALESGSAGETIPIIFNGTTSAPFITRNQTIQGANGGVFGYGILDGILGVTAKQEKESQVKIETGSYLGTGTYGSDNPNTLTLTINPKILFISPTSALSNTICRQLEPFIFLDGGGYGIWGSVDFSTGSIYQFGHNRSGNTINWWVSSSGNANQQLNNSTNTYAYLAIGT